MVSQSAMSTLAFFGNFSGWELMVILGIGLLLFGSRLPTVGRNLGKGITEFKKGLKDVENEVNREDEPRRFENDRSYRSSLPQDDRRVSRADEVSASAERRAE